MGAPISHHPAGWAPPQPKSPEARATDDAAVAHRFRFAADILEGMTDGIDGERLGALVRWALRGEVGPGEQDALVRAFEAPWLAAADEGEFDGDTRDEAHKDIFRVSAEAHAIRSAAS